MPRPNWNTPQPPMPGQPGQQFGRHHIQMPSSQMPDWQDAMSRWNGQKFPDMGSMLQNSPFGGLFGENGLGRFFGPDGMMGRINPNMGQFINQNLSGLQNIPFIGSLFGGGPIAQPPHEIAGIPPDQQNVS